MYGIAITVSACLRSGTRADIAWLVEAGGLDVRDWSDAVVFTPGGGHTGSLLGGALDAKLAEQAGRLSTGRRLDLDISHVDALIAELPAGGRARCLMFPAETLPTEIWDLAASRARFCVVAELRDDDVVDVAVYTDETIADAGPEVGAIFHRGGSGSTLLDDQVVSVFSAVPQVIVVGSSPIVDALVRQAGVLGWQARVVTDLTTVAGHIAPLSAIDKVVVAAHDLELAGTALAAALDSETGYIASLGSRKMQADRADWLAYRGVEDLDRVHGPAGLDIGADAPAEIAVAIAAEAIAASSGRN